MAAHAICFNFITSHSFALAAYKNPLNRTFERTFLNFCDYDSEIAINVAEKTASNILSLWSRFAEL